MPGAGGDAVTGGGDDPPLIVDVEGQRAALVQLDQPVVVEHAVFERLGTVALGDPDA